MRKLVTVLLGLLCVFTTAIAQKRVVTGQVVNEDNVPIPSVSVQVKGSTTGVAADAAGNFSINASSSDVLVFSSVSFNVQEVAVGNKSVINVKLTKALSTIEEVVVTALGISRQTKSLGYTTQQISGDELLKARETSIVSALAGKAAGVRISSQSGTLGGSAKIIIRGQSSFSDPSGGQPIFVIDGLPVDNSSQQLTTGNSAIPQGTAAIDFGNRAGDVNSDDVESINVLKGAAATALYGARAKNGAIIITTKKGVKGRTRVTLNSSARLDKALKLPDLQNEYAQGTQGVYGLASTNGWGPKISDVQDLKFPDFLGRQVTLKAYPDNVKNFYQTGNTYINSISFESGGDQGDFRFGYTNSYQTGIIEKQNLQRNSFNVNAGRIISSKVDIRTTVNYVSTNSKGRPIQASNNLNSLTSIISTLPRTVDISDLRNNYVDPVTKAQIVLTPGRTGNNPFWVIYNNPSENNVERLYGNVVLTYKPYKWLTISDNIGTDFYNEYRRVITKIGTIGTLGGAFFTGDIFNRTLNNDLIVRATHDLNSDVQLTALAGFNNYETYYRRSQSDAQQLTVDELYSFSNASSVTTTNTSNKKRIIGAYGEIGVSYKNYLFLNVTGRNDWSSTLPLNNRSYFYPSVSSSFVFTEVLPKSDILSYGKLRGSWAQVGSDTDPYQLDFTYTPVSSVFGQYGLTAQFPFNGVIGYSQPTVIPNASLRPQKQNSFEVGTDLRLFKNRIRFEFTYYNSKTKDQIVALSLPQSTGFTSRRINAGSIKNQGIELMIGGAVVKTKDFTWDINANFSTNKQTVNDLPAELTNYVLASGYNSLNYRARNGEEIGLFGIGWLKDAQGNFVIDPATGLRTPKTNTRFGDIYPDWMLGVNNSFTYKGVTLSFLIDTRKGGVIYSGTVAALRSGGLAKETLANRDKTFIDKGVLVDADGKSTPNTIPVQSMQDYWGQFGSSVTEGAIFDGSFVKLREVQLAYSLPGKWFSTGNFVKGIDIGLEARNLWIIHDNVPHIDPEVNLFGTASVGEGLEFYSVPSTRSFGVNVKARF